MTLITIWIEIRTLFFSRLMLMARVSEVVLLNEKLLVFLLRLLVFKNRHIFRLLLFLFFFVTLMIVMMMVMLLIRGSFSVTAFGVRFPFAL